MFKQDTIVAQATAPGRGGVGILRISGPQAQQVADLILKQQTKPRVATYLPFYDQHDVVIDQGLGLFLKDRNSFTGEDVLELQGHGGQVVMDLLMRTALSVPFVRAAEPGEFSQRAFSQ